MFAIGARGGRRRARRGIVFGLDHEKRDAHVANQSSAAAGVGEDGVARDGAQPNVTRVTTSVEIAHRARVLHQRAVVPQAAPAKTERVRSLRTGRHPRMFFAIDR